MEQISLATNGEEKGLFSKAQIESMYHAGLLNNETYYWFEGMSEWRPIDELIQVDDLRPSEMPPSVSSPSDEISSPIDTDFTQKAPAIKINRSKYKTPLIIGLSCILIAATIRGIAVKEGWGSPTEVKGTIFVVSADDAVHKLAATDVMLCDAKKINASIAELDQQYQGEDSAEIKNIENIESEYKDGKRQLIKAAYRYSYLFRLFAADEDKSFSISGFGGSDPNGFSHNPNVLAISACFDKMDNLALLDPKDVSDLKTLVDSLGKEIEQTGIMHLTPY